MTAITESITELRGSIGRKINWQLFLQDNVTGSWFQTVGVLLLTLITVNYTIGQLQSLPFRADCRWCRSCWGERHAPRDLGG